MLKFCFLVLTFAVILSTSCHQQQMDPETIRIIFVGDILLDRGVRERIENQGVTVLFHSSMDSIFATSDIVVANLECPATGIKEPINKKYIFRGEPEWLKALKDRGISHLNLANNHTMDQGRNGLVDTEKNILLNGLIPLGFGKDVKHACQTQLIATVPRKIYLLSSVQVPSENWTYLEDRPCVCQESFGSIAGRIIKLRVSEPGSIILVQLHWGAEHMLIPSTYQKQQARMLIDAGADCIIGHHTHTVQTIEYYKGKPVFYGIGNFIFDQTNPKNAEGLMVKMDVAQSVIHFDTLGFVIQKCTPRLKSRNSP